MSYYDELKGKNLIRLLASKLRSGELSLRGSDSKFIANLDVDWNSPWIHQKADYLKNCYLWKDIIFHEIVEKHLPASHQFVPVNCQDCYKVVVKPKTVEQLFRLEKIQEQFDGSCKCGIEIRPQVFGNYGGYFYNRGLEEGLGCYEKVRKLVDDNIEPDCSVILKRGCTEMEHNPAIGPSDKWKLTAEQIEFEIYLGQRFVNDLPALTQSDLVKIEVHQKWIERAYDVGDHTVFKLTDDLPLYPDYITYHHLLEEKNAKG